MQDATQHNRSPLGAEMMHTSCVLVLLVFALFAPFAGALSGQSGGPVPGPDRVAMAPGGCSMVMSSATIESCCCEAPAAPVQVTPPLSKESCCAEPAADAAPVVRVMPQGCDCMSSPQAPHSPPGGLRLLLQSPGSDPNSALSQQMLDASQWPASALVTASQQELGTRAGVLVHGPIAPSANGDHATSRANRIGVLRGQATRLALLATLRC